MVLARNIQVITKGYNNKYNLNVAIQFKEDFYFGININTHEIFLGELF